MQRMEKTFQVGVPVHTAYSQWKQYNRDREITEQVRFERAGARRTRVSLAIEYEPQSALEKAGEASSVVSRNIEKTAQEFREYVETHPAPAEPDVSRA